jgi:hypothetical protein
MNIEVPMKYPLRQDTDFHNKSPMLYRPALFGKWNALSLARRALKDKFPTPTVPLTTVLQNRQVFLPDPVFMYVCVCVCVCVYVCVYIYIYNGFGDLEVACWPLVPKFAGSNPTEVVRFLRAKKSAGLPSEEK